MLYCHCPAGCIVHSDHTFSVTYQFDLDLQMALTMTLWIK